LTVANFLAKRAAKVAAGGDVPTGSETDTKADKMTGVLKMFGVDVEEIKSFAAQTSQQVVDKITSIDMRLSNIESKQDEILAAISRCHDAVLSLQDEHSKDAQFAEMSEHPLETPTVGSQYDPSA
jgi:hypothetical protein